MQINAIMALLVGGIVLMYIVGRSTGMHNVSYGLMAALWVIAAITVVIWDYRRSKREQKEKEADNDRQPRGEAKAP